MIVRAIAIVLTTVTLGLRPTLAQPPSSLATARAGLRAAVAEHVGAPTASVHVVAQWPSGSPRGRELQAALTQAIREGLADASTQSVADAPTVVRLEARALGGHLDLTLLIEGRDTGWFRRWLGWDAVNQTRQQIRVPLDAELRSYVAARPVLTASTVVARTHLLPASEYLDVGVFDIDGAGPPELLLLRRDALVAMRLESTRSGRTRLREVARAAIPDGVLPGVGPRRPVGTLSVESDDVVVRVRHRPLPFRTVWRDELQLVPITDDPCPQGAHPLPDACALPVDGRDYFASELLSRVGLPPPPRASTSFYQRRASWIRRPDGSTNFVEVVVTPRGRLVARTDEESVGLAGYGAGVGMADVDGDGNAELIAASSNLRGSGDQLSVLRIRANGALRRLWQSEPLEGSVLVAGQGDLDGDGSAELLAIEEREGQRARIWVVR